MNPQAPELTLAEFKVRLHIYLFKAKLLQPINFNYDAFFGDLVNFEQLNLAGRNFTQDDVKKWGDRLGSFVWKMQAALQYRADTADQIKAMQEESPDKTYGDDDFKGGTGNPWASVCVSVLPKKMQERVLRYYLDLHHSVSMGGKGYDYRPKGVLFHILK